MSTVEAKNRFAAAFLPKISGLLAGIDAATAQAIRVALEPAAGGEAFPWDAANLLGAWHNGPDVSAEAKAQAVAAIVEIREFMGGLARTSQEPTTVVFGTSGWRAPIGEGFTVENVHKVVRGIVAMMRTPAFLQVNGYTSFEQVKSAGILVFRDNRYMGDAFIAAALAELQAAGIRTFSAGECPTGVGSALLVELRAAGSINFTPSHNPMEYAGLKFNPADGGPADVELTSVIEVEANALMKGATFVRAPEADAAKVERIDGAALFRTFVEQKSKVFDLAKTRSWLAENKNRLFLAIDNMHGSSRGYIETLLGEPLVAELAAAGSIRFLNTEDDYSFHGVKPEPSAKNQKPLLDLARASGRELTLAVALDPDADRIRFGDAAMDIDMNRFGAIAYANLIAKGLRGGIASTVPSSDFALEIAKQLKLPVFEQAVGFKNFREPLASGKAVVAFEESDGISFTGHTLEKCALAGFLSALDAMMNSGKNLSEQFLALQASFGYFYPDKAGADVKGVSVEEWEEYKAAVVRALCDGLYKAGDTVRIGSEDKAVKETNTVDGLKVIFEDKSWILLRPSGTEPKFRYYYELASESPIADADQRLAAYKAASSEVLARARAIADKALGKA